MKPDVKRLMSRFSFDKIKRGDLLITAEIHRVKRVRKDGLLDVVTVSEECCACNGECQHERVMSRVWGQQGAMKIKTK